MFHTKAEFLCQYIEFLCQYIEFTVSRAVKSCHIVLLTAVPCYNALEAFILMDLLLKLDFLDHISLSHWYLKQHDPTNAVVFFRSKRPVRPHPSGFKVRLMVRWLLAPGKPEVMAYTC